VAGSASDVTAYNFEQLASTAQADLTPGEVLAAALAEADQIREQARAVGEATGYAEGLELARAEAAMSVAALAEAIRAIGATRDELIETLTRQAGEVSLGIAEQVLTGTFEVQPERVVDVVRGVLRRLTDRHRLTVVVNPDDLELLAGSVAALQLELGGIEHLDVQADRRIGRGGAIAQTSYGEIDASVRAQMQAAREIVEAALAGDGSAGDGAATDGTDADQRTSETPAAGPGDGL
jgi:flagellar assembly protein FliH